MSGSAAIAITGASGQVGTLLRKHLVDALVEQLPLGHGDDWPAAIASAGAVAHLAGTLQPKGSNTYEAANVQTTRTVAEAAKTSGIERIAFLSYVGASLESPNAYLRSKAQAERILIETGVPTTIVRCVHIFGTPSRPGPMAGAFLRPRRGPVRVPGDGRQRITPLYIGDVVDVVQRALLAPRPPTGIFELVGPRQMSMDEFVRALNGGEVKLSHLPAPVARIAARVSPSLTPALMDLMLADNVLTGAVPSAAEAFGVDPTPIERVWPVAVAG
jgi:nucleoside-diphosphate-sugar epimerase